MRLCKFTHKFTGEWVYINSEYVVDINVDNGTTYIGTVIGDRWPVEEMVGDVVSRLTKEGRKNG
ncbi:hypothetical protein LCGC14_2782360 [marine sediment metagenome]|uniref:Uncharacterized protein n=1 Tax=marine sediment metagenome TaxID=412755 RepID=A0A0F8YSX8_9ZZZZ